MSHSPEQRASPSRVTTLSCSGPLQLDDLCAGDAQDAGAASIHGILAGAFCAGYGTRDQGEPVLLLSE